MIVVVLPVGLVETNCYIVGCEETREAAIIDPGGNAERILEEVARQQLKVKYVLNTHAHFDHTEANEAIIQATGAKLALHTADRGLMERSGGAATFGLQMEPSPPPDIDLEDGDELQVGHLCFRVLYTPGHTPGHVCFYEEKEGVLFGGDILFRRAIGRWDLDGGNRRQLFDSIQRVLFALPEETIIYPGHGMATTIGEEKRLNPWLNSSAIAR